MSDSELIWKFLDREVVDFHPTLYLYVLGDMSQKTIAINRNIELCQKIFSDAIKITIISSTVKAFFEYKKKLYDKGEIKVNSKY